MKITNKDIFKRRMQSKIIFLLSVIVLYTVSSMISGFENGLAFLSVPKGVLWLFQKFIPNGKTLQYLPKIMKPAIETILLALTSTLISSMFALVMAVIGSETLGVSKIAEFIVKLIASFFRNMPVVAWSLLLLTRSFMETIDDVAGDVVEALQVTGASWWQIVFQGVIPSVSSQLVSWVLYYTENNVREATLVGILTGTGIGFIFNLYYRSFRYDAAGLVILIVALIVLIIELVSNKIRKELL